VTLSAVTTSSIRVRGEWVQTVGVASEEAGDGLVGCFKAERREAASSTVLLTPEICLVRAEKLDSILPFLA
jgi:hypothetical protein